MIRGKNGCYLLVTFRSDFSNSISKHALPQKTKLSLMSNAELTSAKASTRANISSICCLILTLERFLTSAFQGSPTDGKAAGRRARDRRVEENAW
jgi:hypothetical protein